MNSIKMTAMMLTAGALALFATELRSQTMISHNDLVSDVRELSETIEAVHPDPYTNSGGKVSYHRRLQKILGAIPDEGMTRDDFYCLVVPFVTAVGDAHTWLKWPGNFSYGLPLYFDVAGSTLYVTGVFSEDDLELVGSRLVSIEGVPVSEFVDRAARFVSAENEYQVLRNVARKGMLLSKWHLEALLPSCKGKDAVTVVLEHPDGRAVTRKLAWPNFETAPPLLGSHSDFELPPRENSDFVYDFIDLERETALLVVDGMESYREAFEMWEHFGRAVNMDQVREVYERFNSAAAPEDRKELMKGIPSATETFISLVRDMREAGTRNLIVDLRRNGGGNSAMAEILVYLLYGKDPLLKAKSQSVEILKYSRLYLEHHKNVDLGTISENRSFEMLAGDYDFSLDRRYGDGSVDITTELDEFAASMPTFDAAWQTAEYDGYYLPDNVIVLCSPWTFSSGYTMMYYLHKAGAKVLGTPSAQAGNCHGETFTNFEMQNSGLGFSVTCKYFEAFPDDPEKGRVLPVDYPMTWEKLASLAFDRNAEILYALEVIQEASVPPISPTPEDPRQTPRS